MPYIIRNNKVEFVNLGSAEMMAAKNCYMTEREAREALAEGSGKPTEASARAHAVDTLNRHAAEKREAEQARQRALSQFKLRLAAGTLSHDEILDLWHRAYPKRD